MTRLAVGILLLGIASGAVAEDPDAREVRAVERRLTRVTVLRPSADSEVEAKVRKLSWSDRTETFHFEPLTLVPERPDARKSTSFRVNEDGTFTASRVKTPDQVLARQRGGVQSNIGVCDPVIESTCGGGEGGAGGASATGRMIQAVQTLNANGVPLRTRAVLGVMPCKRTGLGTVRLDIADGFCTASQGWATIGCIESHPALGTRASGIQFSVTGQYMAPGPMNLTDAVVVTSDGSGTFSTSATEAIATNYSGAACEDPNDGGSGAPPDPDDANAGERYCVPVYDGENGQYLGSCCGTTTHAIIRCAAEYL